MRKELISRKKPDPQPLNELIDESWLDLDRLAIVQGTSQEEGFPIDAALLSNRERGGRAACPGTQTIRIFFDEPRKITRVWMLFEEPENTRTQEFLLRWSADNGSTFREIVRQEWTFSPPNALREIEDYSVNLVGVTLLELIVVPDKSCGGAEASLAKLCLA